MCALSLPPPRLIADVDGLDQLVRDLSDCPAAAIDTESNSLHAYRERVCLVQFSTPAADYILDAVRLRDVGPLAPFFASPRQQKVFHAAEGDIAGLRRDFGFQFANVFDTMTAARTLGWPQVGLAAILDARFGVAMSKKHQKADWQRRPLSQEQLDYARLDTHYLLALRDLQIEALTAAGRLDEATEEFARVARPPVEAEPAADPAMRFWRVSGARELASPQTGILQALFAYREQQAERLDRPPFKVLGEATLMELARRAPRQMDELKGVAGLTPDLVHRYGEGLLGAIQEGLDAPPPRPPRTEREPDDVRDRYDRLHTWRKEKAKARGVESDVILPRSALRDLARLAPRTPDELVSIADLGPWRRDAYGAELLALLSRAGSSSGRA